MIITKQQQNGLQVYDDNSSVKNLSSEKLQSMKNYYIELIDSIKEKNNCLPNGKYTTAGNEALGPVEGVGFFYDDGIKYGYSTENAKNVDEFYKKTLNPYNSNNNSSGNNCVVLDNNFTLIKKNIPINILN